MRGGAQDERFYWPCAALGWTLQSVREIIHGSKNRGLLIELNPVLKGIKVAHNQDRRREGSFQRARDLNPTSHLALTEYIILDQSILFCRKNAKYFRSIICQRSARARAPIFWLANVGVGNIQTDSLRLEQPFSICSSIGQDI